MNQEDKIINDYLTPILGDLMKQSLDSILDMKEKDLVTRDDKEEILFISRFIDEAEQYYLGIKDTQNLAIINDLKQYLLKIMG